MTSWLLLLLFAVGCDRETNANQPAAKEVVSVVLAPVRVEAVDRVVELVGTLFGDEQAVMSAKVPGRVQQVFVDVGDRVAPGQPLAQIDPTDYELAVSQRKMALAEALAKLGLSQIPTGDFDVETIATVQRARFQAANAKAKLERARQLFEQQQPMISEQDFADLQTAWEVAVRDQDVARLEAQSQLASARSRQSDLNAAQQRLTDTLLRAPGAGDLSDVRYGVTRRRISTGEYVREGDAMFDLVVDDPIRMRAAVPERFLAAVKVSQPAHVRVESYPQPFEGTVARINPAIDQQSRTFEIEVNVPNPQRLLRPGAFARGGVVVGQDADVTFVPQNAVVSFAGIDRVFTVADGKAVEQVVRLGTLRDNHVAIVSGLKGDAPVVVSGHQRLSNGQPVAADASATAPAH